MPISQVSLSNTFNEFRQTTNLAINEVNKLTDGTADLVIDTISANSYVGLSSTLNISANSGTDVVSLSTETLRIVGTNGISTSVASTSNTINVTLGATTVTSGAYGNANQVSVVFVDAQGRIASATNTSINILISGNTGSDIVTLGSEVFRFVGTNGISTTIASNTVDVTLGSSGVTAGAFGSTTQIPTFVVNAQGRITSAGNTSISGGGATLTNDVTTNLDTFYPVLANNQISGTLTIANTSSTKLYYNANTGQLNATNFNSLSDARQKENIRTIQNATDKVLLIRGVTFNWIDNKKSSLGVIAQEVEQIIPDAVSTSTSGEKSVNYGALVGLLVETIKEQNVRIEKLESLISK